MTKTILFGHPATRTKIMANFIGTNANETITGDLVSPTVTTSPPGALPSDAVDHINAGGGNDVVEGEKGDDVAKLGTGNDVFGWDPGDGSDRVDGGTGTDRLDFEGANVDEAITVSASAGKAIFHRDVGDVTMTLTNVEHIEFDALGGADTVHVRDLTGTDVTLVDIDLAGTLDGTTGDATADRITVDGTAVHDAIAIKQSGTEIAVSGLAAKTVIDHADPTLDHLTVNGLAGNDTIKASTLAAGHIVLTLDGGAGKDVLIGSGGSDSLIGGIGKDTLTGGIGADHFVFATTAESAVGITADRITDFSHAQADKIDLAAIDANTGLVGNQAFSFIGDGDFSSHAGQLRAIFSGANTLIAGDANGDGHADFNILLTGHITLGAGDFVL